MKFLMMLLINIKMKLINKIIIISYIKKYKVIKNILLKY